MFMGGWAGPAMPAPGLAIGVGPAHPPYVSWARYARRRTLQLRNFLLETYRRLVEETLRHLRPRPPRSFDREDLESAGLIGLLHAVERFDPGRGVRFESFAGRWVRGAIFEEVRRADPWPRHWRERSVRLAAAVARLRDLHDREPTDEEVARALHVPFARYQALYAELRDRELHPVPQRLEEGRNGERGPAATLASSAEPPYERLARRDLLDLALSLLDDREREILRLRYFEGRSMREIGERVGMHVSRVCRVHARTLARLRERLRTRAWEAA